MDGSSNWSAIWGVAIWSLWKWRNQHSFDANFIKPLDPCSVIMTTWKSFVQIQEDSLISHNTTVTSSYWQPPPKG